MRSEPRRVCLMINDLGLGGAEKQVVLLAEGLRTRGVEPVVLVLFDGGAREGALRAAGVPVVHLGLARRSAGWRMPFIDAVAFARLVGHLRRLRPDVLHVFLLNSHLLAAPAAWLARVPVLVAGRRSLGAYKERWPLRRAAERLANRGTALLIANAEAVAEDTRRQEGVPADKVTVVYNGLPERAFHPAPPAHVDTDLPVVLCVGNLRAVKGHRYLLDAVGRLGERGTPCTLVLVGEGAERAPLERQAAELGIDVRFLGARTDVDQLLARADLVVSSSLAEGLSNSIMEAMAAGLPVVGTAVGGTGELLADGRGVLVPPADPEALATAIAGLLVDPGSARRTGAAARAWTRATLHVDAMVDRHLVIYRDLLLSRRRRG
ncbi:glycosyltransferase [Planosporangium sp. 12N6]|uniref:glycosyltransferase n=1 Tax=Planosporangium spinosum TaxID=3402278 RepID=UPI003CF71D43